MSEQQQAFERLKTLTEKLDSIDPSWLEDGRLLGWKEAARSSLRRMLPEDDERERRLNLLEEVWFHPRVMEPSNQEKIDAVKRGASEAKAILFAAMDEFESSDNLELTSRTKSSATATSPKRNVFIVHGHDNEMKETVARFLESKGLSVTILHEKPSGGATIIEKLENHSEVDYAVVLWSPDDVGRSKAAKDLEPRARQNVIYELGLFSGKLGRGLVCVIKREELEIPSDFHGVNYLEFDAAGGWKQKLLDELVHAGIAV